MTKNLSTVNPNPVEGGMREDIDIIPGELLREKVFHAGTAHELRVRAR